MGLGAWGDPWWVQQGTAQQYTVYRRYYIALPRVHATDTSHTATRCRSHVAPRVPVAAPYTKLRVPTQRMTLLNSHGPLLLLGA